MSPIVPCIWIRSQAEQAAAFYTTTLPAGRVTATSRYPASQDNPGGMPPGSVLTVEMELAGLRFTLLNGGPQFTPNASISFFVQLDSVAEVENVFGALVQGGEAMMALDRYPWSERYGWAKDRFGVSWQVFARPQPRGAATIAPCLMFAASQHGRAEEAIRVYTGIFPDSHMDALERYAPGEGPEGSIKHGPFVILGQPMVAMDSHREHGITFDEGVSLQVMCDDQAQVDRYWEALSEGGEKGPCGWLKDRFGLSWQVVPEQLTQWMTSKDAAARDRVFAAIMGMKKLDLAALKKAFEGR